VQRQADRGRIHRTLDHVGEPADAERRAPAHGLIEHGLRELRHALEDRGAARDDDTRRRRVLDAGAPQLAGDEGEDLLDARLDDLREHLARELAGLAAADRRHVHGLLRGHERRERAAVALLHVLGVGHGRAQADRDVVRHVVAAERQDRGVPDGAVAIEGDVRGAAPDVDDEDAELLLVRVQHGLRRGEPLEHDVVDGEPGAIDGADDVLHGGDGAGDDVHLDLQAHARHADGLPDPVAVVHDEALRQDVDDLAVLGHVDRARGLDHALDVGGAHLAVLPGDGDDAAAVHAPDVPARDARVDARDLDARHLLRLGDRRAHRLDGGVDVDDDAAAQPARGRGADADHVERAGGPRVRDQGADLGRAHVQSHDEVLRAGTLHRAAPRWSTTWSRKRRSTVRTSCVTAWARTPSSRASRSSQSSVPRRTSTPSIV
jgi:hypothetical protein